MKTAIKTIAIATALSLLVTACSRHMSNDVYSSSASVGKVFYGTIVSVRPVTIKDTERLQDNGLGGIGGGVAGGVVGSAIGKGKGKAVATVGGAIAGALLGAVIQDQLSTQSGFEYIVRLESTSGVSVAVPAQRNDVTLGGSSSVTADVNRSMQVAKLESQIISVIQNDKTGYALGQRVMIVYRDDHPRLSLAQ